MNYTICMVSYNFAIHVICPLTFTTYKYSVLQMLFATQKLSYKANYKTPFVFSHCLHLDDVEFCLNE
jgi:hypothetical protein